jgi:site-specific DNA-methyltransferase (adenine-specific)
MKKYNIIYADPPWSYNDKLGDKVNMGAVTGSYDTMTIEEIKELPVSEFSDKDCALFLWAVSPLLPEAIDVICSWGFKYKTIAFNWVKITNSGAFISNMGRWTMGNCEVCLLATKGSPQRMRKDIKQLQISERKGHSKKPDIITKRIVDLMGDVPRIELFARGHKNKDLFNFNQFDGWDTWGNEVDNSIKL